ncbi:DUF397 domain-containing protein [Yinghuangia sp. YIM S09857]|uniref:DUF397 domain-containing protein n=1 Tax=Yinghuangia sp. YIM S09857 TaxID=3436929 RepID=UPI003F52E41B
MQNAARLELLALVWRKSSYSNQEGGNCLEVAGRGFGVVPVRDSKDVGRGAIVVSGDSWVVLTEALKRV